MELDEDEVPTLVDVDDPTTKAEIVDASTAQMQDLSMAKVPLTLVTGSSVICLSS